MSKFEDAITLSQIFVELSEGWFREKYPEAMNLYTRNTVFTGAMTLWLMIAQKVGARDSLTATVQELSRTGKIEELSQLAPGSRKLTVCELSKNAGGFSQARSRLALAKVEQFSDHLSQEIEKEHKDLCIFGYRAYVIDGSTVQLQRNNSICKEFTTYSHPRGPLAPLARVVVAHNVVTGTALRPEIGSLEQSEQRLFHHMLPRFPKNSLVIGDRNFGIFSVAWHAAQANIDTLIRLKEDRASKILGKKSITHDGEFDVTWSPSAKDRKTNSFPSEALVKGRVIVVTLKAPGIRSKRLFFFTTANKLSAEQSLEIYKRRWFIETDLRSIKTTVHLDTIYSKTPDLVRKEIILGVVAYSLVRAVIARGAKHISLEPRQISYTRATDHLTTIAIRLQQASSQKEISRITENFFVGLRQMKHPNRSRPRIEPRALIPKIARNFPEITTSRSNERTNLINNLKD